MNLLQGVFEQLGIIVFEKQGSSSFRLISRCPRWFQALSAIAENSNIENVEEIDSEHLYYAFPFIENFILDAEDIWSDPGRLSDSPNSSGIWTELDKNGTEYQLEAKALTVDGKPVLLIENLSDSFADRHAVYQKARDIALINEKLISELNYRQRKLQSDIERHLAQQVSVQEISDSVERNTSAVLVCLPDGDVEVFNKALVDIYEMNVQDRIVRASILDKWISEAETNYPEIHRVLRSGSYWEGEFKTRDTNDDEKWIRLSIGPVKNDKGEVSHFVCVANDLTDYQRVSSDWDSIGEYDYNTHLPNRRQFWKHIGSAFEANAGSEELVALLYIDVDYFKRINDDYGHFAGDFLLSALASRISRNIKHSDFVAHLGGDEFVILLRFVPSEDAITGMAERLLATIREPLAIDNQPISVTASIGCAVSTIKDIDAKSLLRQADLAMYSAKELGKGQIRLYSEELEDHMPLRRKREHELVDAIDQQQFTLEFQPQIPMMNQSSDRARMRVEALVRWRHPELGLIGPGEFIAIAEDTGSVVPLGTWVLTNACKVGKKMLDQNKQLNIAVNISAKQLRHPRFYDSLVECLNQTGFPPQNLELEITESSLLKELDRIITLLDDIRQLGIMIALDDFGSGFSSLNYLKRLPVDYIKIDRSFVRDLPDDVESKAITTSVIHLAHQLKMQVIAEGVETEEQLNFLRSHNVDFIQGYYFHRPMSIEILQPLIP